MKAEDYLQQTEPAVQYLFDGLEAYDSMRPPSIADFLDENGVVRMTKAENEAFLRAHEGFFALEFARASLAGSILQIAYMGLKKHSQVRGVSAQCSSLGVTKGAPAKKFCLGRDVKGIPIGLMIYAGRVQYNHWEAGEPRNKVAQRVFRELVMAYYDNQHFDMAYVLDFAGPRPVSHYIIRLELGWHTYDNYLIDMSAMLGCQQ